MGLAAHKAFQITGRDSVLVKEEHTFNWTGTNGINTTPTFTYHTSGLKNSDRMKAVHGAPMGTVGFHFQKRGKCSQLYNDAGSGISTSAECALEGYNNNAEYNARPGSGAIGTWTRSHYEYTTNGTSWTTGVMPAGDDNSYTDICYWASESKWYLTGEDQIWYSSSSTLPTSAGDWSVVHSGVGEDLKAIAVGEVVHNGVTTEYCIAAGDNGQTCYSTNGTSFSNHGVYVYTGSQSYNKHSYDHVEFTGGSVFVTATGSRSNRFKHCTDPTINYNATNSPGGWRDMDRTDTFGYEPYGLGEVRVKGGKIVSHAQQFSFSPSTKRHLNHTSLSDIQGRTNPWTKIYDEDDASNSTTQHADFGGLEFVNGHWFASGIRSADYTFTPYPGAGYVYNSNSYEPFYAYSLDDMATWNYVFQGFTGTLMHPKLSMVINGLFICADRIQHVFTAHQGTSAYPQGGFGTYNIRAEHDMDKDVYSTPGIGGDTVSVTFDSFYAASPIVYSSSPGVSDSVTQDLDLFNALTAALADGSLAGVSVTNLGSGNGIKVVNTVQGSYANPTVSGSSATCTVNTTLDN